MSADPRDETPMDVLLAHAGFVRGLACALVSGDADVDDIVQETWLAALSSSERRLRRPRSWLASIVRRRAARHHRTRLRLDARHRKGARPEAEPSTSDLAGRHEQIQSLIRALSALPAHYRDALVLRYYEDLPPRRVAERLGVPVETARTRVRRGLEQLRSRLDAEHTGNRAAWASPLAGLAVTGGSTAIGWAPVVVGVLAAGILAAAAFILVPSSGQGSGSDRSRGGPDGGGMRRTPTLVGRGAEKAADAPPASESDAPEPDMPRNQIRIRGSLAAEDGDRLVNAQVRVAYLAHHMREVLGPMTPVGAGGRFEVLVPYAPWPVEPEVDPTPRMSLHLFATADGYRPTVKRVSARSGEEREVELTLQRGTSLAGRVLDGGGRPVGGVPLVALARGPGIRRIVSELTFESNESPSLAEQLDRGRATTDAEGRFDIRGLSKRPYWIYSASPDWFLLVDEFMPVDARPMDFLAVQPYALVGEVRDERTSNRVDARLWLEVRAEDSAGLARGIGTRAVVQAAWLPPEEDFTGFLDVTVSAYADGYLPFERTIRYEPNERKKRLDIRLSPAGRGTLIIQVLKSDGSECKDEVQIDLARPGTGPATDMAAPLPEGRISPIRIEAPASRWVVRAFPVGSGLTELLSWSAEVEVHAEREERIDVRLPPYGTLDLRAPGRGPTVGTSFIVELGRGVRNPNMFFSGGAVRLVWPTGKFTIHYETEAGPVTKTFKLRADEVTELILER